LPADSEKSSEIVSTPTPSVVDHTPIEVAAPTVDQPSTVAASFEPVDSVSDEKKKEPEPVAESTDTEPRAQCK